MIDLLAHLVAVLWPYLLAGALAFGLPLAYLATEVATSPLYGPDERPISADPIYDTTTELGERRLIRRLRTEMEASTRQAYREVMEEYHAGRLNLADDDPDPDTAYDEQDAAIDVTSHDYRGDTR